MYAVECKGSENARFRRVLDRRCGAPSRTPCTTGVRRPLRVTEYVKQCPRQHPRAKPVVELLRGCVYPDDEVSA